jgi:hypothetical protein
MHIQGALLLAIAALFLLLSQVFANTEDVSAHHLSGRTPPPPGGVRNKDGQKTQITTLKLSCGLRVPSKANWDAGVKNEFPPWLKLQWDEYLIMEGVESFPEFLRQKFAPDAFPSSQFCDGIGSCTVCRPILLESGTSPKALTYVSHYFTIASN